MQINLHLKVFFAVSQILVPKERLEFRDQLGLGIDNVIADLNDDVMDVQLEFDAERVARSFEHVDFVFYFKEITHVVSTAEEEETSFHDCFAGDVIEEHFTAFVSAVTAHDSLLFVIVIELPQWVLCALATVQIISCLIEAQLLGTLRVFIVFEGLLVTTFILLR